MKDCLLIANWKMNGSLSFNKKLFLELRELMANIQHDMEVAICPPNIYINQIKNLLSNDLSFIKIGSQDVCSEINGAYTGQVSLDMLDDFGVSYSIIGHSERRIYNHETDVEVANKVARVLLSNDKICPILCVGESLEQKNAGLTQDVIKKQVFAVIDCLKDKKVLDNTEIMERIIIAYEPIWAIGTGEVATAQVAGNVSQFIRGLIAEINLELSDKVRIIYGGSVKANNALELISQPNIDGFLVGGASLDAAEFVKIYSHMCN